jgi:NitT/TauT family transport system permease protein
MTVGLEGRVPPGAEHSGDVALELALAQERGRQVGTFGRALQSYVYPSVAIAAVLIVWQGATVALKVPPYLLPAPLEILGEMVTRRGLLFENSLTTLVEVLIGFGVSVLVGVPLAVLIAYSRIAERVLYPLLVSSQTVPKVAIAPLFVVWFGFGLTPKVLIAFLIAFFPIVIACAVGLAAVEREITYVVRSMGASGWQAFWKVRLPTALPSLFGGLKVAITFAVVGAVVGEFVGADKGLGYVIQLATGALDTKLMLAAVFVLSIMGMLLFVALEWVERRLVRGVGV